MILYQFYSFDAISDWMLFFSDLIVQICHKITHSYKNMFIKSKFKQKRIVRGQGNRTLLYWNYIQFSSNFLRKKNIMHVNLYSFQTLPISNLFWSHFVMIFQIRWVNFLSSFKMNIISIGFMMQNFYWMKYDFITYASLFWTKAKKRYCILGNILPHINFAPYALVRELIISL